MDKSTTFSKTGKGLLEIKNKSRSLSRELFKLLNLIDGRSGFDDLQEKLGRVPDKELLLQLRQLSDLGFIKEVVVSVLVPPPPGGIAAVDDLDFTSMLGAPRKPGFYTSAQTEQRAREESERKTSEANATRAREDAERVAREQAEAAARQIADQKARVEAEVRARAEVERRARAAAEQRARQDTEQKLKQDAEAKARAEAERRALLEEEARRKLDAERQRAEAERKRVAEQARLAAQEAERKRLEAVAVKEREDVERLARETAERERREEAERLVREEGEHNRREEEERLRIEAEARQAREEAERVAREEAERKRREEEERLRIEAEARQAREEAERLARQEAERKRIEEEARKVREEAERAAGEEEERHRIEQEAREAEEHLARDQAEQRAELEREQHRIEAEKVLAHEHLKAETLARQEAEIQLQRERDESAAQAEQAQRLAEQAAAAQRARDAAGAAAREEVERRRLADDERVRQLVEAAQREAAESSARAAEAEAARVRSAAATVANERPVPIGPAPEFREVGSDLPGLSGLADINFEDQLKTQEDVLRKALEEEEMRLRLDEQVRESMERAEREEIARRDTEAREIAEAAQRVRHKEEQREREEAARRNREDTERKATEREERRTREKAARRKAEIAKVEADRRQREEALAKQRADQEERDRQKAQRAALLDSRRVPVWKKAQSWVIGFVILVVGLLAALQFMPMSSYIPTVQGMASRRIGEPVTIAELRLSVMDGFEFRLDGIRIGKQLDIQVRTVKVQIDLSSLLGDHVIVRRMTLEGANINADVLPRLGNWPRNAAGQGEAELRRVLFRDTTIAVPGLEVPTFDADLLFAPDGGFRTASVKTSDGSLRADLAPADKGVGIDVSGRGFTLFAGPPVVFDDIVAKGMIADDGIMLSSVDGRLYGGTVTGAVHLTWNAGWKLDGDFETARVDLFPLLATVTKDATARGQLDAKAHFQMAAATPGKLFDAPQAQAGFTLRKGNIDGVDLVRALQSQSREGVRGGRSRFDELGGTLTMNNGRYQYRNLRLQSGLLVSSGQFEIAADQNVSGRLFIELKSTGNQFRGNYGVLGSLKNMMLKQ